MQSAPTDSSRKWLALAAVGSGTFMSTVDGSIVNIALSTIQNDFNASLGAVEWVVLTYLLGIVCLLPSMGRLGDMIGRKRVYTTGFILFAVSSALCGYAWSVEALIAFRLIQAVGAAMVQSMGAALLVQAFPSSERGRALGYNATIISVGVASGPMLGGLLIGSFGCAQYLRSTSHSASLRSSSHTGHLSTIANGVRSVSITWGPSASAQPSSLSSIHSLKASISALQHPLSSRHLSPASSDWSFSFGGNYVLLRQ